MDQPYCPADFVASTQVLHLDGQVPTIEVHPEEGASAWIIASTLRTSIYAQTQIKGGHGLLLPTKTWKSK